MNTKKIKNLIEILNDSNLESLTYKDQDFEIELKKASVLNVSPQIVSNIVENNHVEDTAVNKDYIKSKLVGIFYSKPSPDQKPFVTVGTSVSEGDVLCIIEAMKVMNEIKASKSGVIESVLVKDGETVDFDQPLFSIK